MVSRWRIERYVYAGPSINTCKKAIIDAGITPYPYPTWLCRIIAIRDYLMVKAAFRSIQLMKIAMPQRSGHRRKDPKSIT